MVTVNNPVLTELVISCQSYLAEFIKHADKIAKIHQAKIDDLYRDQKIDNYQSLKEAGNLCFEKIKHLSSKIKAIPNCTAFPDQQVKEILSNLQQEISAIPF